MSNYDDMTSYEARNDFQLEGESDNDFYERMRVRDEYQANRYFRIMNELAGDVRRYEALRDGEVERVNGFYNGKIEGLQERVKMYEGLVIDFFNENKLKNDKYKLATPWGKVQSRKIKTAKWTNELQTLEFLKKTGYNSLIKTTETLSKNDIKKTMIESDGCYVDPNTGEVVPGVYIFEGVSTSCKVVDGNG